MRILGVVAAIGLVTACSNDLGGGAPVPPPVIEAVRVAGTSVNVLSALVTVRVRGADSVAVRYGVGAALGLTPAVIPTGDSADVPILGLLPGTAYTMRVVADAAAVQAAVAAAGA